MWTLWAMIVVLVGQSSSEPKASAHGAGFGASVLGVGDLDGDGVGDIAAGIPRGNRVVVLSGADRSVIRSWSTAADLSGMGASLRSFGDLNGDGRMEILVGFGDPLFQTMSDYSEWISVPEGQLVFAKDRKASEFVRLGDVDGDGGDEIGWHGGEDLIVLSGKNQRELGRHEGMGYPRRVYFGADRNGDGLADAVRVGDRSGLLLSGPLPGAKGSGISAYFGGIVKGAFVDDWPSAYTGYSLLVDVGDLDGDGAQDLLYRVPGSGPGLVRGVTWKKPNEALFSIAVPGQEAGDTVCLGGRDLNGDGIPDFLLSHLDTPFAKRVTAYSGKGGKILWWRNLNDIGPATRFAWDWIGDATGDGVTDLALGMYISEMYGPTLPGKLQCLDGATGKTQWEIREMDW